MRATSTAALRLLVLALVLGMAASCDRSEPPGGPPSSGSVLILAASSTHQAVEEAARAFEAETGLEVQVSTGGSNALARQILSGIPAHVFLSANPEWAEHVVAAGHAIESKALLANRLVLVVPAREPPAVEEPSDLLSPDVGFVALAGERVPAGIYGQRALEAAGVYAPLVEAKRVVLGQDVRLTLGYVERGEAGVGVVYATDARASDRVRTVYEFPETATDRIVYPVVLLDHAYRGPDARRFYDFLSSPVATKIFEAHGFRRIE